jgi:hypothetical protein
MRLIFAAAYLLALVLHAEWTVLSFVLAAALVGLAVFPRLRRGLHPRVPAADLVYGVRAGERSRP